MATVAVKDAGVWKTPVGLSVKDAGVWKTPVGGWVKSGGAWQKFWPMVDPTITLDLDFVAMSAIVQPGSLVPSYANVGGTGNRVGLITVITTATLAGSGGTAVLIDGSMATGMWFSGGESGREIKFDFGAPQVITEAKWYQDIAASQGTWKWQGSNDNSVFTDIGGTFTLGSSTTTVITSLSANVTAYRYYKILQVGGTTNSANYLLEIDFKIAAMVAATGVLDPRITFSRASTATYFNSAGVLQTAGPGVARFDFDPVTHAGKGLLIEESRVNLVRWNRDLTNVVWTKTNVSAFKDQTGLDGVANSASRITASAANGTCLQTLTGGAANRYTSAYVKRLIGSGVIEMTTDGGTTWTTVPVTASWTRVSLPLQSVTNPAFGFRIATSGDSIAVDYVQLEANNNNSLYISTPIATTTAAVTRAAETAAMTGANFSSWFNASAGTFVFAGDQGRHTTLGNWLYSASDNSLNNRGVASAGGGATSSVTFTITAAGTQQAALATGTITPETPFKTAHAYALNDAGASTNGGTVSTDAAVNLPTGIDRLWIGTDHIASFPWLNGHVKRLTYYNVRKTNAELQALAA